MDVMSAPLPGLLVLRPRVFSDHRGYFFESYNDQAFRTANGAAVEWVQDNESQSDKGVLRGLHFQLPPHGQAKLVRVVKGAVLDVVVDIRPNSAHYGQHFKLVLDGVRKEMLFIPEGFAHGFHTLEDGTIFSYKCSRYYDRDSERTIQWNDPSLAIDWQATVPILSSKDLDGLPFARNPWPRNDV
jgi:dTDP-4-dehydrorhamnose 3,5-epimerase